MFTQNYLQIQKCIKFVPLLNLDGFSMAAANVLDQRVLIMGSKKVDAHSVPRRKMTIY